MGNVQALMREGKELPPGVAVDADGKDTRDPKSVSALLPFGAHKGYGLGVIDELYAAYCGGSCPTFRVLLCPPTFGVLLCPHSMPGTSACGPIIVWSAACPSESCISHSLDHAGTSRDWRRWREAFVLLLLSVHQARGNVLWRLCTAEESGQFAPVLCAPVLCAPVLCAPVLCASYSMLREGLVFRV